MMVTSPDGVALACHRTGSGSPIVLVGGAGFDHTIWDKLVPILAEDHTVYSLDRRGRHRRHRGRRCPGRPLVRGAARTASGRLRELVDAGERDAAQYLFRTQTVGLPAAVVGSLRETAQWQRDLALAHTLAYDASIVEEGLPETTIGVPVRLLLGADSAPPMAGGVHQYAQTGAEVRMLKGQQHFAMISDPGQLAAAIIRPSVPAG